LDVATAGGGPWPSGVGSRRDAGVVGDTPGVADPFAAETYVPGDGVGAGVPAMARK
jgi:hypothetical protein